MNNIYTAINIGPIVATLQLMRKPRHLWCASFIFSHLMTKIISEGIHQGGELLSLEEPNKENKPGIGLFPDRAFFKSDNKLNISDIINNSLSALATDIFSFPEKNKQEKVKEKRILLNNYFNIMGVHHTKVCDETESSIILKLNKKLDALELCNRKENESAREEILKFLMAGKYSKLYEHAFESNKFCIKSLREIAAFEIMPSKMPDNIKVLSNQLAEIHKGRNKEGFEECSAEIEELTNEYIFNKITESYQNYFCIVQADGDNMGKVIASLKDGDLKTVSKKLLKFGIDASNLVTKYGGQPIYTGGDDLLFLCPVVSKAISENENSTQNEEIPKYKRRNIFTLIDEIDKEYINVQSLVKELGVNTIETTMSYGIAISYYKYPLYEAFSTSRHLLFDIAKDIMFCKKEDENINRHEKNSIAVQLRKHSGSPLNFTMSKYNKKFKESFNKLIEFSNNENLVSMVSHKLRANSELLKLVNDNETRLDAFFKKYIGLGKKKNSEDEYISGVKEIYSLLDADKKEFIYSILRIAKFINGEKIK